MPTDPGTDPIASAVTALSTADRAEAIKALRASAPGLFQAIFQEGHNVGYGKQHGEMDAVTARATTLESQVADLTRQLGEARNGGSPDVTKLHADYATKIEDLKEKAKAERQTARERMEALTLRTARTDLRAALKDLGVDADYASVLIEKPEVLKRFKAKEDGPVTIFQDGTEIPIAASNGKGPIEILAEELHPRVPTKFIVSRVDAGAGGSPGGATGSAPPSALAKSLDDIRAAKQAELDGERKQTESVERNLKAMGLSATV